MNFKYYLQLIFDSFQRLPIISKSLIILIPSFYALHLITDLSGLLLSPIGNNFNPIQLFTYPLFHVYFLNALFGSIALWFFAAPVERYWGQKRFAIYLLTSILTAGLVNVLFSPFGLLGSSGLIYTFLLAFGMMWPEKRVQLILPPMPIKAKYLIMFFGGLMLLTSLSSEMGRMSVVSYLAALLACYLLIQFWRKKPPFSPTRKTKLKRVK